MSKRLSTKQVHDGLKAVALAWGALALVALMIAGAAGVLGTWGFYVACTLLALAFSGLMFLVGATEHCE